ncbi:MAG: hypothetical protein QOJ51_3459 [Acidobacteriaceae bacterium]|jgi:hypothetical protein|nr:hypothetical protein [Acidobacteriaceae bacterium]
MRRKWISHTSPGDHHGRTDCLLAHEDQTIAAAITNANTCLRWLAHDQPDLEEPRQAMESAWDSPAAGPSLNRTVAAFGLPATLRAARVLLHAAH